jgi:hypothetical protein
MLGLSLIIITYACNFYVHTIVLPFYMISAIYPLASLYLTPYLHRLRQKILLSLMPELLHSSNPSLFLTGVIFSLITLRGVCGEGSQQNTWINPQAEGAEVMSPPSYMIGSDLLLEWTTDFAVEYVLLYANDGNPNSYEVVLS